MAGRPRTPTNVLKLRGADKVNPGRLKERENEPISVEPIGKAPDWLTVDERKAFRTFVKESIDGVLGEADRPLVAMASKLMVKMMKNEYTHQEITLLNRCLAQMGMNPADRSRISVPQKPKKNRFEDD